MVLGVRAKGLFPGADSRGKLLIRQHSYRTVKGFRTRDDAIRDAQALSFAVYVEVDHSKYITKKSYADNFKIKETADH